ncbi:hypothetical protein A3C23_04835 [Candidatus Roizmanbacteria bacterium RIFCSPHIGHO2_02_FULL_37_13b]|uniref:Cohesin domain-containing protein n=1 Tax=Candidatus Roizmanbacteria bacterium RIFCSPLOWO2_02_FULL_36_11 TaxID=1802071 RepID=A0A1F7JID9_9BACT|nr:MAG: hypothetical protein A3C23_04835 [Candidatus Roizmanbacteria bacterium RIFCSPHIGHO2_02_FULL_37_13b]OGK55367.1 MAG: hypothetical protein A3H78_03630 [Candidatus Roizmanbacteria bacterium RIFCSPLOWO2_02_FULL_36_11]
MENENRFYRHKFQVLILTILILGLAFFLLRQFIRPSGFSSKSKEEKREVILTKTPSGVTLPGKISLRFKDDQKSYSINDNVYLYAYADSLQIPIIGYDLVLKYDKESLKFVQVKSLQDDFVVSSFSTEDALNITGIKKLSSSYGTIFDNNQLLELVFKPKKEGRANIEIDFTQGKSTDSNLTDEKATDILGSVEPTYFYVGERLALSLNQVKKTKSDLQIKLAELIVPDGQCMDCITTLKLDLMKGGQREVVNYQTGGIAGSLKLTSNNFDNHIEIMKINSSGAELIITKFN